MSLVALLVSQVWPQGGAVTPLSPLLLWGRGQLGPILRGCQDGWGPLGDYGGQGGGLAPSPEVGVKDFPV